MSLCSETSGISTKIKDDEYNIVEWLNQLNLFKPKKRIFRDLSDGVQVAKVIHHFYPKLVELHNYTSRFSFATKMENWRRLNTYVLKKLNLRLSTKNMEHICNNVPGVVEKLMCDLRNKIKADEDKKRQIMEGDKVSSDGSWYDVGAIDDDSDIMMIPIRKKCNGDTSEVYKKKVISYHSYEILNNELSEKNEAIDILRQKVQHLENMIKTKDVHINELQKSLSRKNLRSKKTELLVTEQNKINFETQDVTLPYSDTIHTLTGDATKEANTHRSSEESAVHALDELIAFIDS